MLRDDKGFENRLKKLGDITHLSRPLTLVVAVLKPAKTCGKCTFSVKRMFCFYLKLLYSKYLSLPCIDLLVSYTRSALVNACSISCGVRRLARFLTKTETCLQIIVNSPMPHTTYSAVHNCCMSTDRQTDRQTH